MQRSHADIHDLVQARVTDFVNGDSSEAVLRASLKALGLDHEETNIEIFKARNELLRTHNERRVRANLAPNKRGSYERR